MRFPYIYVYSEFKFKSIQAKRLPPSIWVLNKFLVYSFFNRIDSIKSNGYGKCINQPPPPLRHCSNGDMACGILIHFRFGCEAKSFPDTYCNCYCFSVCVVLRCEVMLEFQGRLVWIAVWKKAFRSIDF